MVDSELHLITIFAQCRRLGHYSYQLAFRNHLSTYRVIQSGEASMFQISLLKWSSILDPMLCHFKIYSSRGRVRRIFLLMPALQMSMSRVEWVNFFMLTLMEARFSIPQTDQNLKFFQTISTDVPRNHWQGLSWSRCWKTTYESHIR